MIAFKSYTNDNGIAFFKDVFIDIKNYELEI